MQKTKVIHLIIAARPNFMKVAPLIRALRHVPGITPHVIHTGQHYDANMSDVFLHQLEMGTPVANFNISGGTHARQISEVTRAYEEYAISNRPDLVVVVGDVNGTLGCALAARTLHIPVAHLEAGLRSFDASMPEEMNRRLTDALSTILWTPSEDANQNLAREGIAGEQVLCVGNIMIDSLVHMRDAILSLPLPSPLKSQSYAVATFHRPSNVDNYENAAKLVSLMGQICAKIPLVLPLHPRTKNALIQYRLFKSVQEIPHLMLLDPLSYTDFMRLIFSTKCVITDSGGVQEETTYLGLPCLTLRPNTERPVTVTLGTNTLVTSESVMHYVDQILSSHYKKGSVPPLWDGNTATRVVGHITSYLGV